MPSIAPTTASVYQPSPPSRPMPHNPAYQHYRHSMPVGGSLHYDQTRGYQSSSYHSYQCHGDDPSRYSYDSPINNYTQSSSSSSASKLPTPTASSSSPSPRITSQKKSNELKVVDNTKRQITVKSVNEENRVWIDVLSTDTGASLAAKIHRIATFGTRNIIRITTAQGHEVPLTKRRPVFGQHDGGVDIAQVAHGDYWHVEWVPLDPSLLNKVLSKLIH
ncbi:hypothetical protein BCR42DRAFT_186132 [Absidia repens]|uniref:Uncharacterized protein n=1 Tax=Absidia repens TaxID=90262 RepID=A0A1X2HXT4_9FUNG|nr:hypothetical protein BCR42DRAFT_186132 [Absidia repens]